MIPIKPRLEDGFDPGLVAPEWNEFWRLFELGGGGLWPFWEGAGTINNLLARGVSDDKYGGDLTLNANHSWARAPFGWGVEFQNSAEGSLGITSPAGGFWHNETSQFTVLSVATWGANDGTDGGAWCLFEVGGDANGLACGREVVAGNNPAAIRAVARTTNSIITSSTTYSDGDIVRVALRYDAGELDLFVNDKLEASDSGTSPIGLHADEPGIGDSVGTIVLGSDAWDGIIGLFGATQAVLPDNLIYQWMRDPFGPFRIAEQPVAAFVPAAAVGPTVAHYAYPMRVF